MICEERWQGFLVWPDGRVEEIEPDGESNMIWTVPGLFDELVLAGYPLHRDRNMGRWDGVLDLAVDPEKLGDGVTAYTSGPEPCEHLMGPASDVFLDWYRAAVP